MTTMMNVNTFRPKASLAIGALNSSTLDYDITKCDPVDCKVLVELDPVQEKTAGGVFLAQDTQERTQAVQTLGTVIRVGGNAFEKWGPPIPQPGDRVVIGKFAGQSAKPGEVNRYRFINDEDIIAIVRV